MLLGEVPKRRVCGEEVVCGREVGRAKGGWTAHRVPSRTRPVHVRANDGQCSHEQAWTSDTLALPLDALEGGQLLSIHKGQRGTACVAASSTTDSVHVLADALGDVEVHHSKHPAEVDAARHPELLRPHGLGRLGGELHLLPLHPLDARLPIALLTVIHVLVRVTAHSTLGGGLHDGFRPRHPSLLPRRHFSGTSSGITVGSDGSKLVSGFLCEIQ